MPVIPSVIVMVPVVAPVSVIAVIINDRWLPVIHVPVPVIVSPYFGAPVRDLVTGLVSDIVSSW